MRENKDERKLEVVANERKMTSKDQVTCDSNSRRNMRGELGYSAAVGGVRKSGMTSQ